MNRYLQLFSMCRFNLKKFINQVEFIQKRYLFFHLLLMTMLLFLPVFYSFTVSSTPYQMYTRVYSINITDGDIDLSKYGVNIETEGEKVKSVSIDKEMTFTTPTLGIFVTKEFDKEKVDALDKKVPWVCFSTDFVAYADSTNALPAPYEVFTVASLKNVETIFNIVSTYNSFTFYFLLPMLGVTFIILVLIQLLFIISMSAFTGITRIMYDKIEYMERLKILVFSSTYPAIICTIAGFLIPVVHIFIFQALTLMATLYILARYDKHKVPIDS